MAAQFANLSTDASMSKLEKFLESRSYISGYAPSQDDVAVYNNIKVKPTDGSAMSIMRWYKHMTSMKADFASFPGVPVAADSADAEADDSDCDLFGSDDEEEDEEAARIREERLAAYAAKKSAKPGPIAKSRVLLDVKPWDDETDMAALEKCVRSIQMEGLVWGCGELKPVGFGILKLSILATVVDSLVGVDDLSEKIEEFEDYVQSVDVAAFNKV